MLKIGRFLLCLLGIVSALPISICHAQADSSGTVHPYLGANISISIGYQTGPGWGVEAGVRWSSLYMGAEYGLYSYPTPVSEKFLVPEENNPFKTYPTSPEQCYGIHLGFALEETFYLGAVLLRSSQNWVISPEDETRESWINVGPDVRFKTSDRSHIYIDGSFTVRRGLKLGWGFMF